MEKTFDVNLRFRKWLSNSNKWNKTNEAPDRTKLTHEEKVQILKDKGLF
jgi:hypothetical protein